MVQDRGRIELLISTGIGLLTFLKLQLESEKTKILTIELITRSEIFYFSALCYNSKCNFLFSNFELVTRSDFFLFFNFELVTRKWKNKNLSFELVTQSEI